jgi:hypothetical protein
MVILSGLRLLLTWLAALAGILAWNRRRSAACLFAGLGLLGLYGCALLAGFASAGGALKAVGLGLSFFTPLCFAVGGLTFLFEKAKL